MRGLISLLPGFSSYLDTQPTNSPPAFDAREATIASVRHAILTGQTTCRGVVEAHLIRIETLDPTINAIISLASDSLEVAEELDARLATDPAYTPPPLFCVPTLLKDNFNTADLPTTGGCVALAGSRPTNDAPTVTALRNAGAVVLGKTNLHELALEGLSVSSLGGQTLNPYDLTRTPGGSSGGTGAALAAGLAVLGTGTDTVNSLRNPASANALVSIRPTRGLISRTGVMSVSFSQDVVGPIAKCVSDLAIALTVMKDVGFDERDNATALAPPSIRAADFSAALTAGSLQGRRLGVVMGFFNRTMSAETNPVNDAMQLMQASLLSAGVQIVQITDPIFDADKLLSSVDIQQYEYRQMMDQYLADTSLEGQYPTNLKELYSNQRRFLVIPAQHDHVKRALVSSTDNRTTDDRPSYADVKIRVAELALAVHKQFAAHKLDAIVYPQQKNLVVPIGSHKQYGRNGILAATIGFPSITLPAGFSPRSSSAPRGIPIGMELMGLPWCEASLLQLAYQIEAQTRCRKTPLMADRSFEPRAMKRVPDIVRSRPRNIAADYTVAVPGL